MDPFIDPEPLVGTSGADAGDTDEGPGRGSLFGDVTWRWTDGVFGLLPMGVALGVPYVLPLESLSVSWGWVAIVFSLLVEVWALVFPLVIVRRRVGRLPSRPRFGAVLVEPLFAALAFVVYVIVINLTVPLLTYLIGPKATPTNPLGPVVRALDQRELIFFTILAVIIAPVSEEILFRGLLYNLLRQKWHTVPAMIAQGIVFGLAHPFPLADTVVIGLLGIGLAILYEWRKTLFAPILLHAMVNGFAAFVMVQGLSIDANTPKLGVAVEPSGDACRIVYLAPEGGAAEAGLQVGDVIVSVDDYPVKNLTEIVQILTHKQIGDHVSVEYRRGETTARVEALLKKRAQ